VSDIEKMTKDGVPANEIVERINHAPLTNVIGVGGMFTVRTQPAAGLSGSLLALLHEEGVADPVLDALQGQFLARFIEAERLRYQNIGQGSSSMHSLMPSGCCIGVRVCASAMLSIPAPVFIARPNLSVLSTVSSQTASSATHFPQHSRCASRSNRKIFISHPLDGIPQPALRACE